MAREPLDWFVTAGFTAGDGSKERPFHDPWVAFRHAEPGDRIHIAAGTYYGRHERSSWTIDCPDLTVLGGYDSGFTSRTPWRTPTVLAAWPASRTPHEPNLLQGTDQHDGVILDGLFFDAAGRNHYDEDGRLVSSSTGDGPIVSLHSERITVRNCVFANGSAGAVELAGNGGRFENNLVVNHLGAGLVSIRDSDSRAPIVVSGNTFCFAHDASDPPRGSGADEATGLRVNGAAVIEDNLFAGCGNAAIACYRDVDRVTIERNLFFLTLRDAIRSRATSAEAEITEEYLEEIEDIGLQSATGNTAGDPHVTGLPAAWVDAYTLDVSATYARPPRAALNALRTAAGLGPLPDTIEPEAGAVRRLTPSEVLVIRTEAQQGCHPIDLPTPEPFRTRPPAPAYQPIDWSLLAHADPSLNGASVEFRAGLGFDQKVALLAGAEPTHIGVATYQPGTDDRALYVLTGRASLAHRQIEDAVRYSRGLDVEMTYRLRGAYRTDLAAGARQAVTIVLDSIAPVHDVDLPPTSRPAGRNWFVRAGASGGDGSRDAPFRDPFQALDKAEGGDTIHVAQGEYAGRLRSGVWRIPIRNLTVLGGYSEDFTTRDPWRHLVRFVLTPEAKEKGAPNSPILGADDACSGLVLDGFVFDGSTYNAYADNGALDVSRSPSSPLLEVTGGTGSITVRNCVFVNASSIAVQISSASGRFENNIVVNTSGTAVRLRTPGAGPWTVRDNTILVAADPTGRASSGHSAAGALLELDGRAVMRVESNLLAFADGVAVRAGLPGQNLVLDDNILAANLFADVTDGQHVLIDRAGWDRTAVLDASFGSLSGNRCDLPDLPIDPSFAQPVIDRLASLPSSLPSGILEAAAAAVGVTPAPPTPAPEPEPPAADASASDLLADLGRLRDELEAKDTGVPAPPSGYCPAWPAGTVTSLLRQAAPGARAVTLTVAFAAETTRPPVEYRPVDPVTVDAGLTTLDGTPIEMAVTDVRSSATNSGLYPEGTTRDDYEAFSVAAAGGPTRTRLAVVVRDDTAVSRAFARLVPTDTVRVRGVARLILNGSTLAVIADSVESH